MKSMNMPTCYYKKRGANRLKGLGRAFLSVCILLALSTIASYAQSLVLADDPDAKTQGLQKPSSINDPANGSGVMVSGELWDSFMPPNKGPAYTEAARDILFTFMRIGNFDRAWTTPTHVWPGGWTNGNYWAKGMVLTEWNPDPTFNPQTVAGKTNPSYVGTSGANYAFAGYGNPKGALGLKVAGTGVAARDYARETIWVDAKRHHALYEAGWPTTIGVDVKVKIHQYSLNWNNFNDFILVEVKLTNTGNVDINADGVVERPGNVIHALTLLAHGEFMSSCFLGRAGNRGANRFGAQRAIGYIGDNDPSGAPWDMMIGYPGESAAGLKDMGFNDFPLRFYSDVWSGWSWLGVKDSTGTSDKKTIFGTHPIGVGAQRGWYISGGQGRGLNIGTSDPKSVHTAAMGTWYQDGGKSRDATKFVLAPNPNFFQSGTTGNPESFVPKAAPVRPNGDRKMFSDESAGAFEVATYEAGWTKGFTGPNNFDGDMFSAVGPFRLEVGETITITWAEVGEFRLEGLVNAMAAARWTYANNYAAPDNYPAVPEVRVDNTLTKSIKVRWDNKAEAAGSNFAGYKIYKAAQAKRLDWLAGGMRGLDNYWQNTAPGATPSSLLKPVNPNFSAQAFVGSAVGVPDSWGPYELAAVIPTAQLGTVTDASVTGYNYTWEDKQVDLGFKYWYYVAAYTSGATYDLGATYVPFPGGNQATASTIETSNVNRNGASGLWANTYPFADQNSFYPKTGAGEKTLGAGFIVKSALANPVTLASGGAKIGVKPNPYKKKALFDSAVDAFDHKLTFYNLPPRAKITILDVSGQIVRQIDFTSNEPNNGSVFWDMFSKDGIEVASGLYIYVVEYDGGQHVGYLSILR